MVCSESTTLDDLMAALPGLSAIELKQAMARIQALMGREPLSGESETQEVAVHTVMMEVIKKFGGQCPPYGVVVRMDHYPRFNGVADLLVFFVRENFKTTSRAQTRKIYSILLEMVARRLRRDSVPVSHKTLTDALPRLADICDDQFPGYRQSGLLNALITARAGN